jgi:hypothetical protein
MDLVDLAELAEQMVHQEPVDLVEQMDLVDLAEHRVLVVYQTRSLTIKQRQHHSQVILEQDSLFGTTLHKQVQHRLLFPTLMN